MINGRITASIYLPIGIQSMFWHLARFACGFLSNASLHAVRVVIAVSYFFRFEGRREGSQRGMDLSSCQISRELVANFSRHLILLRMLSGGKCCLVSHNCGMMLLLLIGIFIAKNFLGNSSSCCFAFLLSLVKTMILFCRSLSRWYPTKMRLSIESSGGCYARTLNSTKGGRKSRWILSYLIVY